jgi:hypothetical protein
MSQIDQATREYVESNGLDALLGMPVAAATRTIYESVDTSVTAPYPPDWPDLVRLHRTIRERRVTTILEFGCGWSTFVMADALRRNEDDHGTYVRTNLRRSNPFEIHVVDDMTVYLDAAVARIPADLRNRVHPKFSTVEMTTFAGRICTQYVSIPNVAPDFIYLDGPSQASASGDVQGISTRHPDRLPMSCDILRLEPFLLPGTLVLVDGRTANARFLKSHFYREWAYQGEESDVHWFELREAPLGRYNRAQIDYCLGDGWPTPLSR